MQWFTVIAQLFDYVVKAIVSYKDTEAGAKEWADFINAYENAVQMDLDGDGVLGQHQPTPRQTEPAAQPIFRRQAAPKVPRDKTFVNTNADSVPAEE